MLRGLFEGAQYNSEAGAKCAVYSRARTKQGRRVIKKYGMHITKEKDGSNHEIFLGFVEFMTNLMFITRNTRNIFCLLKKKGPALFVELGNNTNNSIFH